MEVRKNVLTKEVRSGLATAGIAAGVGGHTVGWLALGIAIVDDVVATALDGT